MRLEPASFEVEHFELDGNACLEVRGRWFGVRGRRFMRPALTTVSDGREQRILAVLDHKPWNAEDGEIWHAAFPCSTDPAALVGAELTVAPDVTVALPPPSGPRGARRARGAGTRRASRAQADPTTAGGGTARKSADARAPDDRAKLRREAEGSRDEALLELEKLKRDLELLQEERDRALAGRAAAIDARQEAIEREVSLRIADLRVEFERERAGARLAAHTAHERDEARTARDEVARERDEAARERDDALAERDNARQERNRILAQRDAARTRVEEATRQWELTAALGTRRTLERDAVAVERDRMLDELEKAREKLAALAGERDVALEACDRFADERDTIMEACERATRERDAALRAREAASRELEAALESPDRRTREFAERRAREHDPDDQAAAPQNQERERHERHDVPHARKPESDEGTIELPAPVPLPAKFEAAPAQRRVPRPASAARQSEPGRGLRGAGELPVDPGNKPDWPAATAEMWRARLLAISALFVAVVVLLLLLLTK